MFSSGHDTHTITAFNPSYISRRLIEDITRKNCCAKRNIVIIALHLIFIGKYIHRFALIFRVKLDMFSDSLRINILDIILIREQ